MVSNSEANADRGGTKIIFVSYLQILILTKTVKEISKLASTSKREKASPAESAFLKPSTEFRSGVAKLKW